MQDFNEYVNSNNNSSSQSSFTDMVKNLAKSFDGKPTSELLKAIYEQAKKGKREIISRIIIYYGRKVNKNNRGYTFFIFSIAHAHPLCYNSIRIIGRIATKRRNL